MGILAGDDIPKDKVVYGCDGCRAIINVDVEEFWCHKCVERARNYRRELLDEINTLKKENDELKERIVKMEMDRLGIH